MLRVHLRAQLFLIFALVAIALRATPLQSQQLTIQTGTGKQVALAQADIESLPRIKFTTQGPNSDTFEGVALRALLDKAALSSGIR